MLRHKYLRGGWKIVILLTQITIGVFVWWKCSYSLVLWCSLLRTVEQGICTGRPQYFQVTKWLDHDAISLGPPNFNPELHSPLLRPSTLQCHKLYMPSFLSWDCCKKWGSKISRFFVLSPMCITKSFKTTQPPLNWQGFPSLALGQSTSMYAAIIFANMCGRCLSKYSPLTPRNRLLMLVPSPWHKIIFNVDVSSCAASDLHKLPKWGSATILILWCLFFRYLCV